MKNHIKVNGMLLQTNKRFSQLKNSQKDWIATELYNLYHNKMKEISTTKETPSWLSRYRYEQIQIREKWIPYDEVKKYAFSKTTKIVKSFKKQFPELSEEIEAENANK
jgi:hypothetical protein